MLDHERPWREQHRRATFGRDRIEMRPVVHFGQEHQAVARRPGEVGFAVHFGQGSGQGVGALPDLAGGAAIRVRHPDRPRIGGLGQQRFRRATLARPAGEGDSRPVRRPHRRGIAAGGRIQKHDRPVLGRIDADEGVIAAPGHKGQAGSVRRPGKFTVFAPVKEQTLGLARTVDRRRPDRLVLDERQFIFRTTPPGRRRRRSRSARRHRARPPQMATFGSSGLAGRIRGQMTLGRPVGVMVAAEHPDQPLAVRPTGSAR